MRFSEGQNPFEVKYATRCFIILQGIVSYVMHSMHAVFARLYIQREKSDTFMITKGKRKLTFCIFCKIARINYVYIKFTMVIGLEAFKNKNKVNGRLQSKSAFLQ